MHIIKRSDLLAISTQIQTPGFEKRQVDRLIWLTFRSRYDDLGHVSDAGYLIFPDEDTIPNIMRSFEDACTFSSFVLDSWRSHLRLEEYFDFDEEGNLWRAEIVDREGKVYGRATGAAPVAVVLATLKALCDHDDLGSHIEMVQ